MEVEKGSALANYHPPLGVDFVAFLGAYMGLLGPSWAHLRAYLRHLKIKRAKCKK